MSSQTKEKTELLPVTDLTQCIEVITNWHQVQLATIQHFHEIPPGTEVEVDGIPLKLEGDVLKGFQVGIQTCMNYLGTLPFEAEYEDANQPT